MIALARLPLARLTRSPRALVPLLAWALLALAAAWLGHQRGGAHAADHVLLGAYGSLALPLLVYAVVSATLAGDSLARSGRSLIAVGAAPVRVAAAQILVAVLASAFFASAVGAAVAAIAHGPFDPPLVSDALNSAWIGALGGAAYAAYFCFGATFGARGGGRTTFLVLDWLLGAGQGALAAILPRANLRNLLGGEPPLGLSQTASAALLGGVIVLFGALALARSRR